MCNLQFLGLYLAQTMVVVPQGLVNQSKGDSNSALPCSCILEPKKVNSANEERGDKVTARRKEGME